MDLTRTSAIIAGGASGLGEGAVRRLAGAGVECIIADLDEARGHQLAEELGTDVRFVKTDISDEASMRALFAAERRWPLRTMVTTDYSGAGGAVLDRRGVPHELSQFRRQIDINLNGTFNCMRLSAEAIATSPPDANGDRGSSSTPHRSPVWTARSIRSPMPPPRPRSSA